MKSLVDYIKEAQSNKTAIGHFNVSDCVGVKAIFGAAREISKYRNAEVPIIIGVSEGERAFIGVKRIADAIKSIREELDYPIYLNADHTHSFEKVREAVEAGFDAVLFDGGKFSLEENIRETKAVVDYVKNTEPSILVEGELGYIGSGSVILKDIPEGAAVKKEDLTKPDDARRFVEETGVDLLAPAVGNLHGMFADLPNPDLDIKLIAKIKKAADVPLVLHGGSGIKDSDFLAAIGAGISIIHINTELRLAWRKGMERAFKENPEEIVPYKLLPFAVSEVEAAVSRRLKLFNRLV